MYLIYDCVLLLIYNYSMYYNSLEGVFRVFISYDRNLYEELFICFLCYF